MCLPTGRHTTASVLRIVDAGVLEVLGCSKYVLLKRARVIQETRAECCRVEIGQCGKLILNVC